MIRISIRYSTEEVPGKGWIARAEDIRATAQGKTEKEAFENLLALVNSTPQILDTLLEEAKGANQAELELIPA